MLDEAAGGPVDSPALDAELEWIDARNGSKNLNAAPSRRRSHARVDPRALCLADAAAQRPSPAGSPRAGRAAARLGGDFRQGVLAGGEGAAGAAHALRQMAVAELLRTAAATSRWSRSRASKTARIACCRKRSRRADELPLAEIDAQIRHAKEAPIDEVPSFRKILRVTRLPLPLRRLFWSVGLNFGRQRANWFGNFGVTSVAAYGARRAACAEPGPLYPQLWRGGARPDHRRRDPLGSPHYRCRPDREGPDPAGTGAEHRNISRIARKPAAGRAKGGPGGRDLSRHYPAESAGLDRNAGLSLTEQRFLPRNRLLAGRFRPAMRFATRGPALSGFRGWPVGSGKFPAHRRARLLKTQTYAKRTR